MDVNNIIANALERASELQDRGTDASLKHAELTLRLRSEGLGHNTKRVEELITAHPRDIGIEDAIKAEQSKLSARLGFVHDPKGRLPSREYANLLAAQTYFDALQIPPAAPAKRNVTFEEWINDPTGAPLIPEWQHEERQHVRVKMPWEERMEEVEQRLIEEEQRESARQSAIPIGRKHFIPLHEQYGDDRTFATTLEAGYKTSLVEVGERPVFGVVGPPGMLGVAGKGFLTTMSGVFKPGMESRGLAVGGSSKSRRVKVAKGRGRAGGLEMGGEVTTYLEEEFVDREQWWDEQDKLAKALRLKKQKAQQRQKLWTGVPKMSSSTSRRQVKRPRLQSQKPTVSATTDVDVTRKSPASSTVRTAAAAAPKEESGVQRPVESMYPNGQPVFGRRKGPHLNRAQAAESDRAAVRLDLDPRRRDGPHKGLVKLKVSPSLLRRLEDMTKPEIGSGCRSGSQDSILKLRVPLEALRRLQETDQVTYELSGGSGSLLNANHGYTPTMDGKSSVQSLKYASEAKSLAQLTGEHLGQNGTGGLGAERQQSDGLQATVATSKDPAPPTRRSGFTIPFKPGLINRQRTLSANATVTSDETSSADVQNSATKKRARRVDNDDDGSSESADTFKAKKRRIAVEGSERGPSPG